MIDLRDVMLMPSTRDIPDLVDEVKRLRKLLGVGIYIAGASNEKGAVIGFMEGLRDNGLTITADWTPYATGDDSATTSQEKRREQTEMCLKGVLMADIVWFLAPSTPTRGAWFELGYAHLARKQIIVSGDWKQSIFTSVASRTFDRHLEAYHYIIHAATGVVL